MSRRTFPLIFLALLTGLACYGGWYFYRDYLFAYDSKAVIGRVQQKYMRVGHSRHGRSLYFFIVYTYPVDQLTQTAKMRVYEDTYEDVSQGGPIPIRYLIGEPSQTRIDLPAENKFVVVETYGLVGMLVIASLGTFVVWREYLRGGEQDEQ